MAFHVLLVEPDSALADEIRDALAPLGFSITALQAGEAALDRCRREPPDLILLAAELPDMSGFSVCNRLKRALASVPLLLYTGEATDAAIDAHRATRTRADDYVKKPFELADLLARAAALLPSAPPGPLPPAAAPAPPRPDGQHADALAALQDEDPGAVSRPGSTDDGVAPPLPPDGAPQAAAGPARAQGGPPPVPPPVPGRRAHAALGRMTPAHPAGDPFQVLDDWPRDPAPPKGTPEERLEYFRERLRARDTFLARVRDAVADMKALHAQLSGDRDLLQRDVDAERAHVLELEGKLQEAAQDAAAQAARIEDLRRQLEESESTRQSLSDVLSQTMQQNESAEQQWSARIAAADAERARLEAEFAEKEEGHARALAAIEAERADERGRAEVARAETEEGHARALAAERDERERERAEAAAKLQVAEERITALGVERDLLDQELAARDEDARARLAALEGEAAARAQAAADEAALLQGGIDEERRRADLLDGELADARAQIGALEEDAVRAGEGRAALADELRRAHAEAKAYDEKAVASEHAFHAKAAELAAAEQRLRDLTAALDEGRASAEGTRGELARVEALRAEAERRAAQLAAERDQLGREVGGARRELEAAREETRAERDRSAQLAAEVQRLGKLEPIAEEAARLRKEAASLRDLVQQRTGAAESAARAAQAAAAERARAEERLAVESGRLQAHAARLEQELAGARRRAEELAREGGAREAALRKASQDAEERRKAAAAGTGEAERRHGAEVARLKSAMVELERHLEARARAELQLKKRLQELERAVQARPAPPVADPAEVARLKAQAQQLAEQVEELRGENDFLNGEVARYVKKNKDLSAAIASLRET